MYHPKEEVREKEFDQDTQKLKEKLKEFLTKYQTDYNTNNEAIEKEVFEAIERCEAIIDNAYL